MLPLVPLFTTSPHGATHIHLIAEFRKHRQTPPPQASTFMTGLGLANPPSSMKGLGLANPPSTMTGLGLGLANPTSTMTGLGLGLANPPSTMTGLGLGLANPFWGNCCSFDQ